MLFARLFNAFAGGFCMCGFMTNVAAGNTNGGLITLGLGLLNIYLAARPLGGER